MGEWRQVRAVDEVVGGMRRVVVTRTHGSEETVWYVLVGPKGGVQFAFLRLDLDALRPALHGLDVGYHAYQPRYEGQVPMACEWLVGQDHCFYDGSGLRAERWLQALQYTGMDRRSIWEMLVAEYRAIFEAEHVENRTFP